MAINLLSIQPHKVSRDLSGYITYVYGAPKTGKTTLATQMDGALLLAFERGYNALPGVMAQDITSWTEMRMVYRELKKDEVKAAYRAVIVDTIDIAADMCQKYICNQNGIESLGDLGYGKGWTAFKAEFNDIFRGLTQLGYAVFFIGHDKEVVVTDPNTGTEYKQIRPALSNSTREVITGMADIYGYAHQVRTNDMSVLTLRHIDDSISCGGRFKYLPNEITMSYQNLVEAVQTAIDKEAAEHDNKFVTNERSDNFATPSITYDYDALMTEFQDIVGQLMAKDQNKYSPEVMRIVDKYLGKGKKVSDTTRDQAEFIYLIITEIKDELLK